MEADDADRYALVMMHADECRNLADRAIQKGKPLEAKAWYDTMTKALTAAQLLKQSAAPDLYEAIRDALQTLFLPLHYEPSELLDDGRQLTQEVFINGKICYFHGSHYDLVHAAQEGRRVPLSEGSLGRDEFDPELVYIPPGWLSPVFEQNPEGRTADA